MVIGSQAPSRRVLVAVDATDASEHAAAVAHQLFGDGAEYVLVNVGPASGPSAPDAVDEPPIGDPLVVAHAGTPAPPGDDTKELLEAVAEHARLDHPAELEATGEIARTILDTAHDQSADVIVVGSHDRHWFTRVVAPSTARHVKDLSDLPVLIVKERPAAPAHRQRPAVMVATDGSPASRHAAQVAAALFGPDAAYEVVHVAPDRPDPNADATGFAGPLIDDEEADEIERESLVKGAAAVADAARQFGATPVTETVLVGDAVQLLCEHAAAADVLVLGTFRGSLLLHVLLGSVASRVISHCAVPILAVPETP